MKNLKIFTGVRLPSKERRYDSLVTPTWATFAVLWFLTKGCSSSLEAVGRRDGSRCKHDLIKLFASLERCSGISGKSLLFPILNMAATCSIESNQRHLGLSSLMMAWVEMIGKSIYQIFRYLTPSYWLQGGFEVAISRIVHPKLQISTARP